MNEVWSVVLGEFSQSLLGFQKLLSIYKDDRHCASLS